MKIKILSTFIAVIFITVCSNSQIKVLSTGEINIGKTVGYNYFKMNYSSPYQTYGDLIIYPSNNGTAYLGKSGNGFYAMYSFNFVNLSDARQKENIKEISGALSIIKKLNGIQFDYKKEVFNSNDLDTSVKDKTNSEKNRKNYLGFLAQDVQKILPQIVFYDDSSDLYSMDYTKLIPVLVEAIKEQQTTIDGLSAKINGDTKTVKSQNEVVDINSTESLLPYLAQNAPNPFNQSTEIAYYISEETQKAMLNIYDMNGTQIKSIAINQKGKGSVTIQASELHPGMYMYSLIADGKEIDTKRMILTE